MVALIQGAWLNEGVTMQTVGRCCGMGCDGGGLYWPLHDCHMSGRCFYGMLGVVLLCCMTRAPWWRRGLKRRDSRRYPARRRPWIDQRDPTSGRLDQGWLDAAG